MSPYVLEIEGLHHAFRNEPVLKGISFRVEPGQIVCILGPSGCGKTTLLRIIAGLIVPTSGSILIEGTNQQNIPTYRRNIGFVFQDTALFPHLNVYKNIAFPFNHGRRRLPNQEDWHKAVARILQTTNLLVHEHRSTATLSGGQLQRVALARALVYRPSLLLLDEPLSSLDNVLKEQLLDLLIKLHEEYGTSFLYVTHDEREALRLGTHIAIIDDEHELRQYGTVEDVVTNPVNAKVARIVGSWNLLQSSIRDRKIGIFQSAQGSQTDDLAQDFLDDSIIELGIPLRAITIASGIGSFDPNYIYLPITVRRSIPWYDGRLFECSLVREGNSPSQNLTCLGNSNDIFNSGSLAFARFRKEEIHVFQLH